MQWQGDNWWLATLAAVGAGVCFALAIWGATGHFDRSAKPAADTGEPSPPVVPSPILASTFDRTGYPDGTCLGFEDGLPQNEVFRRSCEEAHLFEVTGTLDLDRLEGDGYPSMPQWAALEQSCVRVGQQYLGRPINAEGQPRLVAGMMRIPEASWVGGARMLPCVLVEVDSDGNMVSRTAALRP
jgi:hypothetical protein